MDTRGGDGPPARRLRVFVAGATGYIGRHVVRELVRRGHEVVCLARSRSGMSGGAGEDETRSILSGASVRFGDVTDETSLARDGFRGESFDAVVSCLATRTGGIKDSWRIEHEANLGVLRASQVAGVAHFVLLSAICVQKPRLAFQHAKLAFERALIASGLDYSIVRPTAFFKSLSGQVNRVKRGKPFAIFGTGDLTACKPISELDLARFMADCLCDPAKRNTILPIGGPGEAITPLQQGEMLFRLCAAEPRYRRIPLWLLDAVRGVLATLGRVFPSLRDKAELLSIGRYYASESMLLLDTRTGRYSEAATPSFGTETLEDFYARVLKDGLAGQELGAHAVYSRSRD